MSHTKNTTLPTVQSVPTMWLDDSTHVLSVKKYIVVTKIKGLKRN